LSVIAFAATRAVVRAVFAEVIAVVCAVLASALEAFAVVDAVFTAATRAVLAVAKQTFLAETVVAGAFPVVPVVESCAKATDPESNRPRAKAGTANFILFIILFTFFIFINSTLYIYYVQYAYFVSIKYRIAFKGFFLYTDTNEQTILHFFNCHIIFGIHFLLFISGVF
jgi:hypothetical protein